MKSLYKILIATLILTSCKSNKNFYPDFSGDAYEAIIVVKREIFSNKIDSFKVRIRNSHGGYFQVNSDIFKSKDSITIKNHIINGFQGTESDTTLSFTKQEFVEKLDYELKVASRQFKIAGNYQTIVIETKDTLRTFYTRRGLGLMKILQDGKHRMTINE